MSDQLDGGGTPPAPQGDGGGMPDGSGAELTFDTWLPDQDDAVRTMVEGHVSGLRTALQRERDERKALSTQLKEALKAAEDGSELQAQLQAMVSQNEQLSQQTAAYEMFVGTTAHSATP